MIYKILFSIVVVFISLTTTDVNAQENSKAKVVLDKFSETFKSYKSFKSNFIFAIENSEADISDSFTGDIILQGDKYRVNIFEMGMSIYHNGDAIYTHLTDAEEVNITSPDEGSNNLMNPASLFKLTDSDISYKYKMKEVVDGISADVITLTPSEDREEEYRSVDLYISEKSKTLIKAVIDGTDENQYTITLIKSGNTPEVADSTFTFNTELFPDVEIIDMR